MSGWGCSGVDEGSRSLNQIAAKELGSTDISSIASEAFAESAHGEGGGGLEAMFADATASCGTKNTHGLGFINHKHGILIDGDLVDFAEWGEVAIDTEEGFGEDEA